MRHGFSLVELSIVLVILGLLTGGILAGQSLIRAAELRKLSTEYGRNITAFNTFRDKYFAIPGDFREATRFWGRMTATADCTSSAGISSATATGSCDGDNNGQIWDGAAANQSSERFQMWRQLALAGLLEGTYSGQAGSGGLNDHQPATNCPKAPVGQGCWSVLFRGVITDTAGSLFVGNYGNAMGFLQGTGGAPIISPEEMWNLDTKLDDGLPAKGRVWSNPVCTNATNAGDTNATYQLTSKSLICTPQFINAL